MSGDSVLRLTVYYILRVSGVLQMAILTLGAISRHTSHQYYHKTLHEDACNIRLYHTSALTRHKHYNDAKHLVWHFGRLTFVSKFVAPLKALIYTPFV